MARRKVEVQLQQEIDTDEQWTELLSKEGLIVIDVYQSYGGPLRAIEARLRALKNQLGDDKLHFAIAKADNIQALEFYRGKSEPCFLFYAGGQLVSVIRGANAPAIVRTINEQLTYEHKVLKGEAQRKPISDPVIEALKKKRKQEKAAKQVKSLVNSDKPITIAIIKPDMIEQGKKAEIVEAIKHKGYEILEEKTVKFTPEMAHEFYKHHEGQPHFDDLIKYMTSGESCVLALSKQGVSRDEVVDQWRNDLGPLDIEQAKKEHPESLRAHYANDRLMNGLHGSDSHETATRELAFFFPPPKPVEEPEDDDEASSKTSSSSSQAAKPSAQPQQQRTIALIRPSAFAQYKDKILDRIKQSGFQIAMHKTIQFDRKQAEEFYAEQKGQPFFNDLVTEMSSGPMMALCLVKENAVKAWRDLLGPKEKENVQTADGTLRHDFDVSTSKVNSLHGASTPEQAEREIKKLFPVEQTLAVLKPDLSKEKKQEIEKKIKDSGFIIASKKSEKLTEDLVKEMYKQSNDKAHFSDLVNAMTTGETEILMLSRENAIEGWRELIGPADPNLAKQQDPHSLRAIYGVDVLHNAVHGPSDKKQAENEINLFFGEAGATKKGKSSAKKQQLAQPNNPNYTVEIKTANETSAGTDGEIFISLVGDKDTEVDVPLKNARINRNLFEKGQTDVFDLELKDVGKISKIAIEQKGSKSGSWKLDQILIMHNSELYTFEADKWLDPGSDMTKIELTPVKVESGHEKYEIQVKTGDEKGAGTDANVKLVIFGSEDKSVELSLDKKNATSGFKNLFEADQLDTFRVHAHGFDKISKIHIGHDSKGVGAEWRLDFVKITHKGHTYTFTVNGWVKNEPLEIKPDA